MKRVFVVLAAIAAFGFVDAAFAADMPVKAPVYKAPVAAPYDWTGLYAGINGGYGWDRLNWTNTAGDTSGDFNGRGWLFGGTLGANWQMPGTAFVLGVEGDWSWTDVKATSTATACGAALGLSCETDVKWLATIRGRLGYAFDRFLVYGTVGAAFAKFSPSIGATPGFTDYNDSGWTAGGGVEYALYDRWSVKAEYLYMDFGTSPVFVAATGITSPFKMSVARAGLNYKFW